MNGIGRDIVAVIMAIIGLAVIALLIKNAGGTSAVIGASTGGLSQLLSVAQSGGNSGSSNYSNFGMGMPSVGMGVY